ncbi:unnamed protein product [Bubo scandiacus]
MLFIARNGCTKSADAKETAFDWAVKHGNLEMAEMVAKAGVDVNAKSVTSACLPLCNSGRMIASQSCLQEYNLASAACG